MFANCGSANQRTLPLVGAVTIRLLTGDCRDVLRTLPDESVHCCVTSPPYWGLRDYGIDSQIGLEPSPDAYVAQMVAVFREVRRVLRKDGTLWLNFGDSYNSIGHKKSSSGYGTTGLAGGIAQEHTPLRRENSAPGLKHKDLVGVPWRVAFALQAPDYLGHIRNEADRAWLAALVDGEGCISILETTSGRESGPVSTSYPPILQVRMCDPECIEKAMLLVGSESTNPARHPPSMEGQRPAYQWRIHGRKAADTIAEIYPFLLIKRKQAVVAWNAQAAREGYETKRGVKVPTAASEKQKFCREIIQKLNQREPIDLPSWMVEPPLPVGPGWYLRQDLIWSKANPMPESVTDRCTKAHEYIFLMSKAERYYYDAAAIAEPSQGDTWRFTSYQADGIGCLPSGNQKPENYNCPGKITRNKRSVWEVATAPFSEAHFATFPPALIEPCIKAGTSEKGCCAKCGAPWVREIEKTVILPELRRGTNSNRDRRDGGMACNADRQFKTVCWSPSCSCEAAAIPCTVLDPFAGAGTTGLVADRLCRSAILIELNPEYAAMAESRLRDDAGMFAAIEFENKKATTADVDLLKFY